MLCKMLSTCLAPSSSPSPSPSPSSLPAPSASSSSCQLPQRGQWLYSGQNRSMNLRLRLRLHAATVHRQSEVGEREREEGARGSVRERGNTFAQAAVTVVVVDSKVGGSLATLSFPALHPALLLSCSPPAPPVACCRLEHLPCEPQLQ